MTNTSLLGPWVRRFLLEHLVSERNLARNTQRSYRDTLRLLLPFVAGQTHQQVDHISVPDVSPDVVRQFLRHLEETRNCTAATRNQRLAAIRSLARFVGMLCPEYVDWCGQLRNIPLKRTARSAITYLEKSEMDALLRAPDQSMEQGRRDHALLLFLYNTGARADEAAGIRVQDFFLAHSARDHSLVQIRGKGNKLRRCPLWPQTSHGLSTLIGNRSSIDHIFLNRCGQPITRFGIHTMVERYAQRLVNQMPSLASKRVSPHTIRHYAGFRTIPGDRRTDRRKACHSGLRSDLFVQPPGIVWSEVLEKCE
jgi:site-specific recombinase XerD